MSVYYDMLELTLKEMLLVDLYVDGLLHAHHVLHVHDSFLLLLFSGGVG